MKTIANFSVNYFQQLTPDSELLTDHLESMNQSELIQLYKKMQLVRAFDYKVIAMQRTGQVGTYPSVLGQEAIGVAMGDCLQKGDVLCPYYRDQATHVSRGVDLKDILLLWGGHEKGYNFQGDSEQDLPGAIPISTQITHAAGIASAFKIRGEKRAVLTSCGDGATSRGDFLESINLAGVWHLPMVIVVNNNQWAISVPLEQQTACETIAQKAISAGFHGEQVDGNDIVALHERITHALDKARHGKGPTLIEAITYRLCDHTTADDASRYRNKDDVEKAWQLEPISRLKNYLLAQKLWSEKEEELLQENINNTIQKAVEEYLAEETEHPISMFDHLYHQLPDSMASQRKDMLEKIERMQ